MTALSLDDVFRESKVRSELLSVRAAALRKQAAAQRAASGEELSCVSSSKHSVHRGTPSRRTRLHDDAFLLHTALLQLSTGRKDQNKTHTTDTHHGHTPRTHTTDTHHGHTPRTHTTDTHHGHTPAQGLH
ncbi:hypothetical protein EYF80_056724 [Liparis tanakae]|uniref:Uncharacterized protein n=1 Tax=Liparis tanakae TaxID=230148 RepID=A0A4Z2EWC4_9TELE|nr:hypothetical protein EYF80_056724 [Liparis tanakae]